MHHRREAVRVFILTLVGLGLCSAAPATGDHPAENGEPVHTLVAVGDIMLAGSSTGLLERKGYAHPFRDPVLAEIISSADVAFANLEYPIASPGQAFVGKRFTFNGSQSSLRAIRRAGFDLLSLANNHIMDYGPEGLASTIQACKTLKLTHAGAGARLDEARRLQVIRKNGVRYGLLAYSLTYPREFWATDENAGTVYGERRYLEQDIPRCAREVDILIVSFHWGEELNPRPRPYQIELAHLAVDLGAAVVLGHHPHIPQPIEIYRGAPIFYSLGNFAFGSWSANTPFSFVAEIRFLGSKPARIILHPINVNNHVVHFQPRALKGDAAREVITYLTDISAPYGTVLLPEKNCGVIELIPLEYLAAEPSP
ncbi:MAG TPA: CapA family protein [Deltaproteobacteria bacterium]|nr:CapA family protein [Deltaproteobacteria bacterium]